MKLLGMNLVVPAENFASAKNETNFTIKLNIWQIFFLLRISMEKKKSLAMFLRFAVANDPSSRKRVEREEKKQPMQLEVVHTTCYS